MKPVPSELDPRIIESGKQTQGERERQRWPGRGSAPRLTRNSDPQHQHTCHVSSISRFTVFHLHHQSYFSAAVIVMQNQG